MFCYNLCHCFNVTIKRYELLIKQEINILLHYQIICVFIASLLALNTNLLMDYVSLKDNLDIRK